MHDGRRVRVVRSVVELLYRSRRILEVIKPEIDGFNVSQWFTLKENVRKNKNTTDTGPYDMFTLPVTETETDIDTNKFTEISMGICVDVCLCTVCTLPQNSTTHFLIGLCIGLGVGQCEHIINCERAFTYFSRTSSSLFGLMMPIGFDRSR